MIEKAHSKLIEHGTTLNREQRQELIDELLILFNVVGQSEQLKAEGRKEATEEIRQWLIEMDYEGLAESL